MRPDKGSSLFSGCFAGMGLRYWMKVQTHIAPFLDQPGCNNPPFGVFDGGQF